MPVEREIFGHLPDGTAIERVTLRRDGGLTARIISYGAALQALLVADSAGAIDDVVLGFDALEPYTRPGCYFGMTVGRYANRIAGGRFVIDGAQVSLARNNGPNALHGGIDGFSRKAWRIVSAEDGPVPTLTLACRSPDGEEGYPGTVETRLRYSLPAPGELLLDITATSDRATVVNLTNHSFFNLDGTTAGDILQHRLQIAADHFLAVDETAIPLQEPPRSVTGTPFDFREAHPIGARIRHPDEQLRRGRGYDHNFCLVPAGGLPADGLPTDGLPVDGLRLAARVEAPRSGRIMELHTNQPGLQLYSGNFLDGSVAGKHGRLHRQADAFCLEPQIWPDAPNRPDFPSARLTPGMIYRHRTLYRFTA
ncbi:galactose mutarotase [Bosea sp. LjRoot9]|uniref:aldose epimerase family protein n=1 Tax=Bosea sp. LjRoot9 TaxID=3342341 RepID=UPI003ED0559B